MAKFKIGDRVKLIESSNFNGHGRYGKTGECGKIVGHGGGTDYVVQFDASGQWFAQSDNLELVEQPWQPKAGDRVRMKNSVNGYKADCGAKIIYNDGSNHLPFAIAFDERQKFGHSAEGRTEDGFGYWVGAADIELLPSLKIEAGKCYKTRDGRKVGPVRWDHGVNGWIVNPGDGSAWGRDGTVRNAALIRSDLVAEWIDEPAVANDNAATAAPKFKVGDVVRFRDDYGALSYRGKRATVVKVSEWGIQVDVGGPHGISTERPDSIELFSTRNQAIVALIDDGVPKPATRPKVHTNQDDAAKEAERLALLYPGQEFGVFVLATSKIADTVTEMVTRAVLRAA